MMSLKTIRIWIIGLSVVIGITLAGWIILHFALQIDSMNEIPLISRFWYGIENACAFTTILLACVHAILVIYGIFVAIYSELHEDKVVAKTKHKQGRKTGYNDYYNYNQVEFSKVYNRKEPNRQKPSGSHTPNKAVIAKVSSLNEDW